MGVGQARCQDVYGALVATDPIGSLWMVPMTDILTDIHAVLNAAQVWPTNQLDPASNESNNISVNDASTESNTDRTVVITSVANKLEPNSAKRNSPKLCPECDLTEHEGPCSEALPVNVVRPTPTTTRAPDSVNHIQSNIHNTGSHGYSTNSSKSIKIIAWFCSECREGPSLEWQISCPNCGHEKCNMCPREVKK